MSCMNKVHRGPCLFVDWYSLTLGLWAIMFLRDDNLLIKWQLLKLEI